MKEVELPQPANAALGSSWVASLAPHPSPQGKPAALALTALLASSIKCTRSSGWVALEAWLVCNVIVFLALIRSAIHFSVSVGIKRSLAEI
jgi:hypothetical protein